MPDHPTITTADATDYEFVILDYVPLPQAEELRRIERAGIDGVAFRKLAKKAAAARTRFVITSDTAANAKTLIANLRALQGTVVTVKPLRGSTLLEYADVVVQAVFIETWKRIAAGVGGPVSNPTELIAGSFLLTETDVS